jgi:hypothetical protein
MDEITPAKALDILEGVFRQNPVLFTSGLLLSALIEAEKERAPDTALR